jgi:hypothetical protein
MKKVHYGWIILIITFFSIIVAGIIRASSGVLLSRKPVCYLNKERERIICKLK